MKSDPELFLKWVAISNYFSTSCLICQVTFIWVSYVSLGHPQRGHCCIPGALWGFWLRAGAAVGMFALPDIVLRYQHNFHLDFAKKEMPVHSCEYTFFSLKSIFTN